MNEHPYFKVSEGPVFAVEPSGVFEPEAIPGWKSIWRGNYATGTPLAVVGSDYHLVPNESVFRPVEATLVGRGVATRYGTAFGGARTWGHYRFTRDAVTLDRWSTLMPELTVRNSYDGGAAISAYFKNIDGFCDNGMVFQKDARIFSLRHTKGLEVSKRFVISPEAIENYLDEFRVSAEVIRAWRETRCTPTDARQLLAALKDSERWQELMFARYESETAVRGDSLWAMVSALTWWATHGQTRQTARDHVEQTVMNRQLLVFGWLRSGAFKEIETR